MTSFYIVSTPIGNLKDITLRALEVLQEVDLIIAEDTRRTKILLNQYNIKTPLLSYYEQNRFKRIPYIISLLQKGKNIALVSDAGTPGISDPAYRLIRSCLEEKITVTSIPGPSSVITALVQSGLPTDRFIFEGFLPKKKGRKARFERLRKLQCSIILFESPERLIKTLSDCMEHLGNRPIAVCRELTKRYEDIFRGTLEEAINYFKENKPRGEFVLIIGKDDPNVYFI